MAFVDSNFKQTVAFYKMPENLKYNLDKIFSNKSMFMDVAFRSLFFHLTLFPSEQPATALKTKGTFGEHAIKR